MSVTRFSFFEQWGHIGSELGRAQGRSRINDELSYYRCLDRAFAMLSEMIDSYIGIHNLKEVLLFKELLGDIYAHGDKALVPLSELEDYCNQFAIAGVITHD